MPAVSTPEPMSAEQAVLLTEFARACKSAARAASLYPGTHPAIQGALSRVVASAERLAAARQISLFIEPDRLSIDGRAPGKPDQSIAELAWLLHERLISVFTIEPGADAEDWRALLLQLARSPEDLIASGGIVAAWTATGRSHFTIREIDYAEVLRERPGSEPTEWDRITAYCMQGDTAELDDQALSALVEAVGDPARFGDLIDRVQDAQPSGATSGARAAAVLQLIRTALDAANELDALTAELALQTIADSTTHLTPDMMLALLGQRASTDVKDAQRASAIVDRIRDDTVSTFVARSVASEHGATERLAQAFEALVPESERKQRLLTRAHDEARVELGGQDAFEDLWQGAADMLMSYSDENYVHGDYARELTTAREQAIEVERVSDDPPERVAAWLATVSEAAIRQLDLDLLQDLLAIERDPAAWETVAAVSVAEIERLVLLGHAGDAQKVVASIVKETTSDIGDQRRWPATRALEKLASGPVVRHIAMHFGKVEDGDVAPFNRVCLTVGHAIVRPLAETLAVEENNRAIRRLRELLLEFGAAGRQAVERLKSSSNPAVRRAAIDLLRVSGGNEALPELASMLDDADPQVQRESIRAIARLGTEDAYEVLQRALVAKGGSRQTVLQQLLGLRDDKITPLLCYVLTHTTAGRDLVSMHLDIIEALGGMKAQGDAVATLRQVLYRGDWWAPFRTKSLRHAAALALRRIGSPEAMAILEEAASGGSRGVRNIARARLGPAAA